MHQRDLRVTGRTATPMRPACVAVAGIVAFLAVLDPAPARAQPRWGAQQPHQQTFWDDIVRGSQPAVDAALERGREAEAAGNLTSALDAYRGAIQFDATSTDAWSMALRLSLRTQPDVFDRLLAQAGEDPQVSESPPILFFRGVQALRDGAWDDAIDALERATRYRSQLTDARVYYGNLAEAHMAAGQPEDALFYYRQALADDAAYVHARAGLVLAMLRTGRVEEATEHARRLMLSDAHLSFLDEPGVFLVPEGDDLLLRAVVAAVAQQPGETERWLGLWETSPSAASTSQQVRDAVAALATSDEGRVVRWSVPGCRPIRVDVTPERDRAAVVCEGSDLRVGEVRGDDVQWERVTGYEHPSRPTEAAYNLTDIAWSPDGSELRLLWTSNQVEAIEVSTGRSTGLRGFGNADLRGVGFDNSGELLAFTSFYTGGLQLAPFDAANLTSSAGYLSTVSYPTRVRITSDGRRAGVLWNGGMQVYDTATWQFAGELMQSSTSTTTQELALMDDGATVVLPRQGLLLVQRIGEAAAGSFVVLPGQNNSAVLAINAVGADAVVASVPDALYVVRLR